MLDRLERIRHAILESGSGISIMPRCED